MINQPINPHGSFNGVTVHENAEFLYQSKEATHAVRWGIADYCVLIPFGIWGFTSASYMILPALVSLLYIPRRVTQTFYFTWHAELIPHEEVICFWKSGSFGGIRRIYVDVKNLEKVDASFVKNNLMWTGNMFDQNMVFRDMESLEVFVFDKNGIWNEDTLNHKLLY